VSDLSIIKSLRTIRSIAKTNIFAVLSIQYFIERNYTCPTFFVKTFIQKKEKLFVILLSEKPVMYRRTKNLSRSKGGIFVYNEFFLSK